MARTDSAARELRAGPERVYAALLDPDALVQWLPPDGMTGGFEYFDARVGGSYRLVLTYEDNAASAGKANADSDVVEVRFIELVPNRRVQQAVDFVSDDPAFSGTMTMTWELSPEDGGTRVEVTAVDVPGGITPEDHAAGLASSLANLELFLEG